METSDDQRAKVAKLIKEARVAMLTHADADGRLVSCPMATQDVDFDGTVYFITDRHTPKVAALEATPAVNVAYSGSGSWVSLSGRARIVHDVAKLRELWDTFTDSWLEGGPDNPDNVLIEVAGETAEYWDTPGGKVTQLVNLVKSAATGTPIEGDNEVVQL